MDFSRWVEQGFGTADCIIIADGTLRIIDYKHGLGVLVSADENPQMQCYALGALELFDGIYDIDQVSMDADRMRDAVSHDYVCAEYKNHYRNSDNFLSADCLPVDCDNDHSEDPKDWITPADVLEAFPGVSLAIHYSRFNQREKNGKPARPKFHGLWNYISRPTPVSGGKVKNPALS